MGFSRQEYWNELPVLSSEDLPTSGIFLTRGSNPHLPYCRQMLYHLSYQGRAIIMMKSNHISTRWASHKLENKNYRNSHTVGNFWAPHQASHSEGPAKWSQGIWLLRLLGLDHRTSTVLEDTNIPLLEQNNNNKKKSCVHQDLQKRSNNPTGDWARPTCKCCGGGGDLLWRDGSSWNRGDGSSNP